MRVNIDFDTSVADDLAALRVIFGGAAPAVEPEKKPRKPVTPVAGNPDAPPAGNKTPVVAVDDLAQHLRLALAAVTLRADAPVEIVNLSKNPTDKDTLGKAVLKACKPKEEGGITRAAVLALLEPFRPASLKTPDAEGKLPLLKLGVLESTNYAKIAGLILAEYKA